VILAQGTADVLSGGQTPRYRLLLPRATFQPLLGAGHAPQSDRPTAIVGLIRRAVAASHAGPATPPGDRATPTPPSERN
jgi:pimeloyl-ACP methyl ester carboxylesterase